MLQEKFRHQKDINIEYSLKIEKLQSHAISNQAINESAAVKQITEQFMKAHDEVVTIRSERKILIEKYEKLKKDKESQDHAEERHKRELKRFSDENEKLRKELQEILKTKNEAI